MLWQTSSRVSIGTALEEISAGYMYAIIVKCNEQIGSRYTYIDINEKYARLARQGHPKRDATFWHDPASYAIAVNQHQEYLSTEGLRYIRRRKKNVRHF